ncbi:MAG TPA: TonB-dependent receptor [Steroidobacteraceae bacterium]|nr:TonB-dependent receptor [Steroidobacteraceae bacterium]
MNRKDRSKEGTSRAWLLGLALLAPACAALAQTSNSQTTPSRSSDQSSDQLQEVVVTGIRYSLSKALQIKRNAVQDVQVISADDIGKLPDKNVADAVQRLPGIDTASAAGGEGGFDENDRVAIRGTSPSLTQTTINGHAVASGDWFITDQYSLVGRSVSYTLLPSETVSSVVVYKTQTADMTEGGVAGDVNLQTIKPLDLKKDFTAEAFLGGEYGDLAGKASPQGNALLAWKNDGGSFGVLAQGFYEERKIQRDGQEFLGYNTIPGTITKSAGATVPNPFVANDPALIGAAIPSEIGSALFQQTRKREGGLFDVEFAPNDKLSLDLNGFYSDLKADNYNTNYMAFLVEQSNDNYVAPTTATVQNGTVVAASWPAGTANTIVYDEISRPGAEARTWYLDLDGKYAVTDNFTVTSQLGYTQGLGNTPSQPAYEACQSGALSYQMNGLNGPATVTFGGSGSPTGAAPASTCWAWNDIAKATDSETYGQLDGLLKLADDGIFQSVKFGARYAEHGHVVNFPEDGGCLSSCWSTFPNYTGGLYPSSYPGGLGSGPLTDIWMLSQSAIADYVADNVSTGPSRLYWQGESYVRESDWAAYGMANIGGTGWAGNFGVRAVYTHELSVVNLPGGTNPITTSAFGPYTPSPFNNNYIDILPSASLKFDLSKDLVLRFSAAETMARPDYSALGGAISTTDLNWVGSGGNPNLKPIRSANYDSTIEWYFGSQSLLAASLFYMDFSSYVDYGTSTEVLYNQQYKEFGAYTITSPFNTTAQDQGFELQYEQPIWKGFGVQANYTHATGSTAADSALVGMSNETYNVVGYWENKLLSVRLAYTYRSHFLVGLDRSYAENQDDYGSLDASVNVNITDNISLSFDAMNLTDEILKYYGNNTSQPRAFYDNGRQYYAGVHLKL